MLPLLALCSICSMAAEKIDKATDDLARRAATAQPDKQSLESIRQTVETFVLSNRTAEQRVSVTVKPLDKRLRLINCQTALTPTWSNRSRKLGRVTVQVACTSPKPWRVHVQATVTMEGRVWTLVRGVARGELLSKDMLMRQEVTLGANNAAYTSLGTPVIDIEPWLGFSFAQRVNTGKVLNERMLIAANVLTKGDAVVIRHRSNGLELLTRGVALSNAGAQEQTQVRNSSSGKVIDVVVVSTGTVEILQ